jgi:hypothetical protein
MGEAERRRMGTLVSRARARLARIPKHVAGAPVQWADRILDRGLDTSGNSTQPEHRAYGDGISYVPSPWYVLPRALWYIGVSEGDTFVDFGCGKGRVVHQAARRPFAE